MELESEQWKNIKAEKWELRHLTSRGCCDFDFSLLRIHHVALIITVFVFVKRRGSEYYFVIET